MFESGGDNREAQAAALSELGPCCMASHERGAPLALLDLMERLEAERA
jgi:hypothetical protein